MHDGCEIVRTPLVKRSNGKEQWPGMLGEPAPRNPLDFWAQNWRRDGMPQKLSKLKHGTMLCTCSSHKGSQKKCYCMPYFMPYFLLCCFMPYFILCYFIPISLNVF